MARANGREHIGRRLRGGALSVEKGSVYVNAKEVLECGEWKTGVEVAPSAQGGWIARWRHVGGVSYSGPYSGDEVRLWKDDFNNTNCRKWAPVAGDVVIQHGGKGSESSFVGLIRTVKLSSASSVTAKVDWYAPGSKRADTKWHEFCKGSFSWRFARRSDVPPHLVRKTTLLKLEATLPKKRSQRQDGRPVLLSFDDVLEELSTKARPTDEGWARRKFDSLAKLLEEAVVLTNVGVVHGYGLVAARDLHANEVIVDPRTIFLDTAIPPNQDPESYVASPDGYFKLRTFDDQESLKAAHSFYINEAREIKPNIRWTTTNNTRPCLAFRVLRNLSRGVELLITYDSPPPYPRAVHNHQPKRLRHDLMSAVEIELTDADHGDHTVVVVDDAHTTAIPDITSPSQCVEEQMAAAEHCCSTLMSSSPHVVDPSLDGE